MSVRLGISGYARIVNLKVEAFYITMTADTNAAICRSVFSADARNQIRNYGREVLMSDEL
jgi:hypothetical protein